ncbi:ion transporter [Haloarculaceae archaeon H-GB2-1]|nr:ion transporter [Haloarculaceae archaeon H-GB1-1]MEA5386997.1 ion transporter [Haloarculaceae archaeon H-GB11]MEA5408499.1 ion transporter [Haloarculaceae archaeon H-GB2-1]
MDARSPGRRVDTPRDTVRFYLLDHQTAVGKFIDVALLGLNFLFVAVFVVETYPHGDEVGSLLWQLEVAISVVFLVEYVLRLYGARDRVAEFLDPYTIVDLLSIVPTLVLVVATIPEALATVGLLRIVRVARVLRFYRFTKDEEFFFGTVSVETLRVMKLLLTILTLLFVAAGAFYTVEVQANPRVSNFGDTFYYMVVTLTTVGFGDITPATSAGRLVTVAAILAGIILIPWQASKIVREWTTRDKVDVRCPECGLAAHDRDASHCKACGHVIYQEYESSES